MKMRRLAAPAWLILVLASSGAVADFCNAGTDPNLDNTFPPELSSTSSSFGRNTNTGNYELTLTVNVPSQYIGDGNSVVIALGQPGIQGDPTATGFAGPTFTQGQVNASTCTVQFSYTTAWSNVYGAGLNYLQLLEDRADLPTAYTGIVLAKVSLTPTDADAFQDGAGNTHTPGFLYQIPFTVDFPDMVTATLEASSSAGMGKDWITVEPLSAVAKPTSGFVLDGDGFTEVQMRVRTTPKAGYRIAGADVPPGEHNDAWAITVRNAEGEYWQGGTVVKQSGGDSSTIEWLITFHTAFRCDLSDTYLLTYTLECVDRSDPPQPVDTCEDSNVSAADMPQAQIDLVLSGANVCPRVNSNQCENMPDGVNFAPVTGEVGTDKLWPYEYNGSQVAVSVKVNRKDRRARDRVANANVWFFGEPQEDPSASQDENEAWGVRIKFNSPLPDNTITLNALAVTEGTSRSATAGADPTRWEIVEQNECYAIIRLTAEYRNWRRFAAYCDSKQADHVASGGCFPPQHRPSGPEAAASSVNLFKLVAMTSNDWTNSRNRASVDEFTNYIKLDDEHLFPTVRFDSSAVSDRFRDQSSRFSIIEHDTTNVPLVNTLDDMAQLEIVVATSVQYPYVFNDPQIAPRSGVTGTVEAVGSSCSYAAGDRLGYTQGRLDVDPAQAVFDRAAPDVNVCVQKWRLTLATANANCNFAGTYDLSAQPSCVESAAGDAVSACEEGQRVQFGMSIDEGNLCERYQLGNVFMTKTLQAYSQLTDPVAGEADGAHDALKQDSWVKTAKPKMLATLRIEGGNRVDTRFESISLTEVAACVNVENNVCLEGGWVTMDEASSPYYTFNQGTGSLVDMDGRRARVKFGLSLVCDMMCANSANAGVALVSADDNTECAYVDGTGDVTELRDRDECEAESASCVWRRRRNTCDDDADGDGGFMQLRDDQIQSRPIRATFEVTYRASNARVRRRVMATSRPSAETVLRIVPDSLPLGLTVMSASVTPASESEPASWNFVLFLAAGGLLAAVAAMAAALWCRRDAKRPQPSLYQRMEQGDPTATSS